MNPSRSEYRRTRWALIGLLVLPGLGWASACTDSVEPGPSVASVDPSVIAYGSAPVLTVRGSGFRTSATVDLSGGDPPKLDRAFRVLVGDRVVPRVVYVDRATLQADTPADLPVGIHDVSVETPLGRSDTLEDALEVRDPAQVPPVDAGVDAAPTGDASVEPDASIDGGDLPDATTADDSGTDAADDASVDVTDAGEPVSDAGPLDNPLVYPATVADCIDPGTPDPDWCETDTAPGEMAIDLLNAGTNTPLHVFVRFDIPDDLTPLNVTRVRLRLHTTQHAFATAPSSGEIWQVEPFTRADLFIAAPQRVGAAALAGDLGALVQDQLVEWELPVSILSSPGSVYLGVFPLADDGTNFYNAGGTWPPLLVIDYQ